MNTIQKLQEVYNEKGLNGLNKAINKLNLSVTVQVVEHGLKGNKKATLSKIETEKKFAKLDDFGNLVISTHYYARRRYNVIRSKIFTIEI